MKRNEFIRAINGWRRTLFTSSAQLALSLFDDLNRWYSETFLQSKKVLRGVKVGVEQRAIHNFHKFEPPQPAVS